MGRYEICELLLANGSRVEAYNEFKSQVKRLTLSPSLDVSFSLTHLAHLACSVYDMNILSLTLLLIHVSFHEHLLSFTLPSHSPPNLNNSTQALHLAAQWNHPDVCRLLIDHGAMVDARTKVNWTPLHVACREGKYYYYYYPRSLRSHSVDTRYQCMPPVHPIINSHSTHPLSISCVGPCLLQVIYRWWRCC